MRLLGNYISKDWSKRIGTREMNSRLLQWEPVTIRILELLPKIKLLSLTLNLLDVCIGVLQ